jgi:16S rRNA (guanine527-N7)-methyltransferase
MDSESEATFPDEGCGAPSEEALEKAIEEVLLSREAAGKEPLPAGAVTRLATHAYWMCVANETMNLTRITDPRGIAVKHVLDSLLAIDAVDFRGARVLDVGTGAGYPGIPIAIAVPSASVVLLDGTEKKAIFVEDAIEKLGLKNAAAVHGRAEVHLKEFQYDYLVARAVGPLDRILPLLLARRDRFGALVAMKGPGGAQEWEKAADSGATRGFECIATYESELPDGAGARAILVIAPTGKRRLKPAGGRSHEPRRGAKSSE